MTTPERLKRRQRREEILLILLGLAVGVSSLYFHGQDVDQRECITSNFSQLAETLSVRGDLSQKDGRASRIEGRASRWESLANQDFYADIVAGGTETAFVHAYARYSRRVAIVNTERGRASHIREQTAAARDSNPFPAFPEGTCDGA